MSEYKLRGLPKQISNLAQIYQLISFIDSAISEKRSVEAANKAGIKAKITKIELPEMMQYFFEDSIVIGMRLHVSFWNPSYDM